MDGIEAEVMDLLSSSETTEATPEPPEPSESAAPIAAEDAPSPSKEEPAPPSSTAQEVPAVATTGQTFDYNLPLNPREQQLLERIERITGEKMELSSLQQQAALPPEPPPKPEEINFLEGLDLDQVFSSAESMNQLLLAVYNRAMENAANLAAERAMQNIPSTISTYVMQHLASTKMVDSFYESNPDLVNVKQTVAAVANEISANHPEYTLQQVLDEAGKGTREVLRLRGNPPAKPVVPTTRPSALPGQRGGASGRFSVPELEGLEKEINDLLSATR